MDRLRGLAIALMFTDHALAVLWPGTPLRWTITRAGMPIFALLVGALSGRPLSPRRRWLWLGALAPAAVFSWTAFGPGDFGWLILLWLLVGRMAADVLTETQRYLILAVLATVVANVGAAAWPGHYHPAAVVALVLIGGSARPWLTSAGTRLPTWLAWPGRHALAVYVGHLGVLAGVVAATS